MSRISELFSFRRLPKMYNNVDKITVLMTRNELLFWWILSMCKLRRIFLSSSSFSSSSSMYEVILATTYV